MSVMRQKYSQKHRQEAKSRLSSVGRRYFELIEFDDDEELVAEIRKHPFGLLVIEVVGSAISAVVMMAFILLAMNLNALNIGPGMNISGIRNFLIGSGVFLGILGLVMTFISGLIYQSNVIYVTTDKLAQVLYKNIIDRKISQLSIGDVQDVTVSQTGIFSRIFNFGTLVVETAGEQQNYHFTYVPNPYESAKAIVSAHEANLKLHGN